MSSTNEHTGCDNPNAEVSTAQVEYDDKAACKKAIELGLCCNHSDKNAVHPNSFIVRGGGTSVAETAISCLEYRSTLIFRAKGCKNILNFIARHDENKSIRILAASLLGDTELALSIFNVMETDAMEYVTANKLWYRGDARDTSIPPLPNRILSDEILWRIVKSGKYTDKARANALKLLNTQMEEKATEALSVGDDMSFVILLALYGNSANLRSAASNFLLGTTTTSES